jgi:hypothetical protein
VKVYENHTAESAEKNFLVQGLQRTEITELHFIRLLRGSNYYMCTNQSLFLLLNHADSNISTGAEKLTFSPQLSRFYNFVNKQLWSKNVTCLIAIWTLVCASISRLSFGGNM